MIALLDFTRESTISWPLAASLLIVGVAGLLWGGHLLVQGAVGIARKWGMSTLLIGLTIVAFGTSAPELALNVVAAIAGETALAFGNVVGSNIANLGLVLGLTAMVAPIPITGSLLKFSGLPWLIAVTAIAIALPFIGAGVDGSPGYARWAGITLLALVPLTGFLWYRSRQHSSAAPELDPGLEPEPQPVPEAANRSARLSWLLILGGLVLLIAGGKSTETGAVSLARWLGLSEAVIGLSIVAVATSLPEVVTSLIAARRGEPDLAIGTVVGSNLFNLALVLGATSVISPVMLPPQGGLTNLIVMGGLTLLLLPQALSHRKIVGWEGLLLLLIWAGTITWGVMQEG